MKAHPAYHLRLNKAVDRYLLVECLNECKSLGWDFSSYTYVGMGGPLLEDVRLLLHYCPGLQIISVEEDHDTYLRQLFHLPQRHVKLVERSFKDFIESEFPSHKRLAVWSDYVDFNKSVFNEYISILKQVGEGSVVKVTVPIRYFFYSPFFVPKDPRREYRPNAEKQKVFLEDFKTRYGEFLPDKFEEKSLLREKQVFELVGKMFKIAAQRARPTNSGFPFTLIDYSFYNDGTPMVSISGLVCARDDVEKSSLRFAKNPLLNPDWNRPQQINLPFLSLKERLFLERFLPASHRPASELRKRLGYAIGPDWVQELDMYAHFCRLYPDFVRVRL